MMDAGHMEELSLVDQCYLANRAVRLRHLFHHHLRWEHELALHGGAFALQWADAQGQWHVAVIDSVFLDIHRTLITSLIADIAAYGARGQALVESVSSEQLQAFHDDLFR